MAKRLTMIGLGLACAALVGCANVPTSGPVEVEDEIDTTNDDQAAAADFSGPLPGQSQTEIIDGFIDAMSQYEDGYETARKFLTADAEETWAPSSGITITDGGPDKTRVDDKTFRLDYGLIGTLGQDASYLASPSGHTDKLSIKLSKLSGEWRISELPEGLIMSSTNFVREFGVFNTYFFDPSFTYLVPDPVYLPKRGPTQTLLVRALLDGPSDWLGSSVVSQFPDGTQLGVSSVPVERNTATVELNSEASGTDEERERMAAQLTWTLGEHAEVSNVLAKTGAGLLLDEDPSNVSDFENYDPNAMTRRASLFGIGASSVVQVSPDGEVSPVAGPLAQLPGVREVAVHPIRGEAVAINESGAALIRAPLQDRGSPESIYTGTLLSSVSWDWTGVVWAIDSQADGAGLVALTREGDVVPVTISGQDRRDIEAVSVSPDGTRLALVIDGEAHVWVIKRGSGEVGPIEIISARRIGPPQGSALDVAWSNSATVAVLIDDGEGTTRPFLADLSGSYSVEEPVPGAVALAVAPFRELVVETSDGRLFADGDEFASARGAAYPG